MNMDAVMQHVLYHNHINWGCLIYFSGIEYGGCVMNTNQLKVVSKTEPDQSDHSENEQGSDQGTVYSK